MCDFRTPEEVSKIAFNGNITYSDTYKELLPGLYYVVGSGSYYVVIETTGRCVPVWEYRK